MQKNHIFNCILTDQHSFFSFCGLFNPLNKNAYEKNLLPVWSAYGPGAKFYIVSEGYCN
jgi:hypothetical protein